MAGNPDNRDVVEALERIHGEITGMHSEITGMHREIKATNEALGTTNQRLEVMDRSTTVHFEALERVMADGFVELRVEMRQGFADVGARIDNFRDTAGEHVRSHGSRITKLERRVSKLDGGKPDDDEDEEGS